jgi:hypothetical protein
MSVRYCSLWSKRCNNDVFQVSREPVQCSRCQHFLKHIISRLGATLFLMVVACDTNTGTLVSHSKFPRVHRVHRPSLSSRVVISRRERIIIQK